MDTTEQMEIRVETVKENADGSADALIHFNAEGLKYLIQHAVIDILTKYVEQHPIEQIPEKKVRKYHASSKRKASTKKGLHRRTRHDT